MAFESTPLNKTTIILAGVSFLTFAVAMSMYKRRRIYIKTTAKITKLIIYPVKSLQGVEVDELEVTRSGVRYGEFKDRYDCNGELIFF